MAIKKKITPETSDLLRYVKGRVSEEERNLIEEWASESPENEKELLDVAKIHLAAGKGVVYSKEKTEAAFIVYGQQFGKLFVQAGLRY